MEHGDLIDRLRRLGREPIDPDLAVRHLGRLASAQTAGRRPLARVAVVAVGCLLLVGAPAAALVAASRDDGPEPLVPAATDEDGGKAELSCSGPPPFAGEPATPADPAAGEVPSDRAAEAEAFEAWREANCPDDETTSTSTSTSTTTPTAPDAEGEGHRDGDGEGDGCTGPPPFAGEPATPADPGAGQVPSPRAEEAREHAERRQACGDRDGDAEDQGGDEGPEQPPARRPGGPPPGVPGGPPGGPGRPGPERPGPPDGVGDGGGVGRGPAGPRGAGDG